jgi:hypothetical protein
MAIIPTSTPDLDKYCGYTATTIGEFISKRIPVKGIFWCLTSLATSTWTLKIDESTAVHGTTEERNIIPSHKASTTALQFESVHYFPIDTWVNSMWITTLSGGTVNVITAPRARQGFIF